MSVAGISLWQIFPRTIVRGLAVLVRLSSIGPEHSPQTARDSAGYLAGRPREM
jgi:hypothetical protein